MAEKINDGGPAFPVYDHHADGQQFLAETGLALRDYFAAKAMQAYFTDPNAGFGSDGVEAGSQAAYRIADAMLKARGQQ